MKEFRDTRSSYLAYSKTVRGLSQRTLEAYEDDLDKFETFLQEHSLNFLTITRNDVRSFLAQLQRQQLSQSTMNRVISGVKGFYAYSMRYGIIQRDPFDRVQSLREQRKLPTVLTEEEVQQLLDAPGDDFYGLRDSVLFHVLYSTGCRLSEMLNMNVQDLNIGQSEAVVRGKGEKDRYVFLTDAAVEILSIYLPLKEEYQKHKMVSGSNKEALVINRKGKRISAQGVHYIFEQYCRKLGFSKHVTPHTLRHSFATHILDRDAGIRVVQELLGHEHISTTQIYSHVGIERLRSVYEKSHPHGRSKS